MPDSGHGNVSPGQSEANLQDPDTEDGGLIDPQQAFQYLMDNLGGILCMRPR